MSTRGAIAVGTLKEWKGIYNHSDSYPTYLGAKLYEHITRQLLEGKTLAEVAEGILLFDDWRNYLAGGVCQYCGKLTTQPHSFFAGIYGKVAENGTYPDPDAKQHSHTPAEEISYFTPQNLKDSWLEWVYIIDPAANVIHVLDVCGKKITHAGDMTFSEAPNFEVLECGAEFERCGHYAWKHFPEVDRESQGRINTLQYLGKEGFAATSYAIAYLVDGQRVEATGSGCNGAYVEYGRPSYRRQNEYGKHLWCAEVIRGGVREYIPVARLTKTGKEIPYRGVTWIFPPTLVNPQETQLSCRSRVKAGVR